MVRKLLTAVLLLLAPASAWGADAIIFADAPSQSRYVRIWTSSTAAVADELVEGSGAGAGRYAITDSLLVTAGLSTAGVYQYKIFEGATASTTADHTAVGVGTLYWNGSAALTPENYLLLTTTSDTGSGTLGRALHYLRSSWASSGVYSIAALANAPSGGGGGGTIATTYAHKSRTWTPGLDGSIASNVVTVKAGASGTFSAIMPLNAGADISTVTSVEVTDPNDDEVVATDLGKTADGLQANFDLPELTVAGDYEVIVTCTTIDGDTIVMECPLTVRE